MVRSGRRALVGVLPLLGALLVATPARAAQAEITVDSAYADSGGYLQLHGTVTCTEPTGTAHLILFATQVQPFSFGTTSLDVSCAGAPVFWEASVYSSSGWQTWHTVLVNASMTDGHGG